jgi:hypothetical protein
MVQSRGNSVTGSTWKFSGAVTGKNGKKPVVTFSAGNFQVLDTPQAKRLYYQRLCLFGNW